MFASDAGGEPTIRCRPVNLSRMQLMLVCIAAFISLGWGPPAGNTPCQYCHPEKQRGAFVHTPARKGACLKCHDPRTKSLRKPRFALCTECHNEPRFTSAKHLHPLTKRGQCEACHSAHRSNQPHVLVTNPLTLCRSCHSDRDRGRSHPIGPGIKDPNTRGMMTCTSTCHEAHGSRYDKLLTMPQRKLCRHCHNDK